MDLYPPSAGFYPNGGIVNNITDRLLYQDPETLELEPWIATALPEEAKWVLILCMYIGRLGPMTLGAALAVRSRVRMIQLPYERPIVG